MNYQELLAKKAELMEKAQSYIKTMEEENRDLNEQESAEFEEVNSEIKDLNSRIEKYALFGAVNRTVDDVSNKESFFEFVKSVKTGNTLSEVPVPSTYVDQLFAVQPSGAIVANDAYIVPQNDLGTTSLTAVSAKSGGYFGGVTVHLNAGEGFSADGEGAGISKINLTPKKNVAVALLSNDLFRVTSDISNHLLENFAKAIYFAEDNSFLLDAGSLETTPVTTGNAVPIFGCDGELVVNRGSSGVIGLADIMNMLAAVVPGLDGYKWVMSNSALAAVMNITNGTGGPRVIDLVTKTLFGIPYFVSPVASSLGTPRDIALICPQYYAIKRAKDVYINAIPAAGDQTRFELISYSYGAPLVDDVIELENGDEVSPFIVLGATK